MQSSSEPERYDAATIIMHWTTAATVALLWVIGQTIDDFPRGMPRTGARTAHILLGAALALLVIVRIIWRLRGGRRLAAVARGLWGRVERAAHWLLYLLLLTTVSLGIANAWIRGDTLLGLFKIPSIAPGDKALRELVEDLHATAANVILIAAALHALVALVHHYRLKDGVLRRMGLARGTSA
jgi:cytochrome b561